jgi:predicted metal-binding protein
MASKKLTLLVCRSCIRENKQTDPKLMDEETLRATYTKKMKKTFFGQIAELRFLDCLTNCQNPDSVQINRGDQEMLFGKISSERRVDEVVELVRNLRDSKKPLAPSDTLKPCLVFVRSQATPKSGEAPIRGDRIKI